MPEKDDIAKIYRRIAEENERHDQAFQRGREEFLRQQNRSLNDEQQLQRREKAFAG